MANQILAVNGWEKWHGWHAQVLKPTIDWFCDQVGAPGRRILDAACGTGLPSIELAQRVRPGGRVVATDVSEVMLAAARRKSAEAGVTEIEHRQMAVEALALPDASFDTVTCSFGLIYCPDPVKGASELRRVLEPGGRLALSAWETPDHNKFFTTLFGTIGKFLGGPPPDPQAPGPFRLSAPGELERTLAAAGWKSIEIVRVPLVFECESVAKHWETVSELVTPLANAVNSLPAGELDRLKQGLADAVAPFVGGDGRVRMPQVALCATARG